VIIALTGTNEFLIKQTLDRLVADFTAKFGAHSIERVGGEALEVSQLASLLQGGSLFAAQRLVVLRDAAANRPLWDALADWLARVPAETTLVIIDPAPDKRTRTYKELTKHGDLRVLQELSVAELSRWLQSLVREAGSALDPATANYLVQRVGTDQWFLWQEMQKLLSRSEPIDKTLINELTEASPQASAFDVLDAALNRKLQIALDQLKILAVSEDPYKFFGLLVSQIYALAVVMSAGNLTPDVIAKDAGLHPFVVRKTQALARGMGRAELQLLIEQVARTDMQFKTTGADPWTLLEQLLGIIAAR
jgi:DNA polymerase III subunit delta